LEKVIADIDKQYDPTKTILKKHQFRGITFMKTVDIGTRGHLAYHDMGTGKSIYAAGMAIELIEKYKPLLISTKSLHANFRNNIRKYITKSIEAKIASSAITSAAADIDAFINKSFAFVTSNAYNMDKQLLSMSTEGLLIGKSETINLDGFFIIIDESHEFFRAVLNESKNAIALYDAIARSRNSKVLLLTGTPIDSDVCETQIWANLLVPSTPQLSAKADRSAGHAGVVPTLFPESYQGFLDSFVGQTSLINTGYLLNRLMGLVSRVPIDASMEHLFPKQLPIKLVNVEMTQAQFTKYDIAKRDERDEGGWAGGKAAASKFGKPKSQMASTYKVKSRQACNFVPESGAAKYEAILKNISPGVNLAYSQFVGQGGLGSFTEFLRSNGWSAMGESGAPGRQFAIVSGEVEPEERDAIIKKVTDPSNAHGEICRLILISSTGATGIDLKFVRAVHVIEPYWKWSRINQIIARAVRYESHTLLPEDERIVQPYIYMSVIPHDILQERKAVADKIAKRKNGQSQQNIAPRGRRELVPDLITTDQELYGMSIEDMVMVKEMLALYESAAIECADGGCRRCQPTSTPLYTNDFYRDLKQSDPCQPIENSLQRISVTEVVIDGRSYYYKPSAASLHGMSIFSYNDDLASYVELSESTDEYQKIYDEIKKR
jgi:hypothetical protein